MDFTDIMLSLEESNEQDIYLVKIGVIPVIFTAVHTMDQVKKDGDIICYHFYNRNDVEDYLYNNTRFDRASRSRYNFASLYRGADGEVYMKLNLQIRFKK